MRRFYQESWQGIPFTAFTHLSFFRLADSEFYSTFYEELFRRYDSWQALPAHWRTAKEEDARWLAAQIMTQRQHWEAEGGDAPSRVLSIGSGLGYMEKILLDTVPDIALYVNEPSTIGMKWLRAYIPADRIFIGLPPACLPSDVQYNIIYLSALDYCVGNREFAFMLRELRAQLAPGGRLMCLSASLLDEDSLVGGLVNASKILLRALLHFIGTRPQQFWGWRRTRKEYQQLLQGAGFTNIQDGWIGQGSETYWISGE